MDDIELRKMRLMFTMLLRMKNYLYYLGPNVAFFQGLLMSFLLLMKTPRLLSDKLQPPCWTLISNNNSEI